MRRTSPAGCRRGVRKSNPFRESQKPRRDNIPDSRHPLRTVFLNDVCGSSFFLVSSAVHALELTPALASPPHEPECAATVTSPGIGTHCATVSAAPVEKPPISVHLARYQTARHDFPCAGAALQPGVGNQLPDLPCLGVQQERTRAKLGFTISWERPAEAAASVFNGCVLSGAFACTRSPVPKPQPAITTVRRVRPIIPPPSFFLILSFSKRSNLSRA